MRRGWQNCGFNSKLVRLKDHTAPDGRRYRNTFQFQTGAIKRVSFTAMSLILFVFQFQTGAIKSALAHAGISVRSCVSIPNWCD